MTSPRASASGPLWAVAHDDGTIIDSDGVYRDFEDAENTAEWLNSTGQVHAVEVAVRVIPGHGRVVPVHLVEAIDLAFDGSNAHSDEWITNVRAAIRAAKEGAI